VLATKGDLLDQQRKLKRSGLAEYFHHIEVMYDKNGQMYSTLLKKLGCEPGEFIMIGNSMKSDILPVLNIGGHAIYIPFHSTWEHEKVEGEISHPKLYTYSSCMDLLEFF
jgi:putative hydrolase of the HAD superfamily